MQTFLSTLAAAVCLLSVVAGHPGEHHDHAEIAQENSKRNAHAQNIARGLEKCAQHPEYLALQRRAHQRRAAKATAMRQTRGIPLTKPYKTRRSIAERDLTALETFETYNHNLTGNGYTTSTDASVLFANYNNVSCILTPEVTWGPYYVTGEYIRQNVTETQEGVALHLEYQYIDISTCAAATGLYLDTWEANSTGVYSGVLGGNGNEADTANLNRTDLRGMQPVDDEGVAAFDTIFPGHYQGRATHIHLIAHQGGEVLDNGTYSGGTISHVGQLFFQENLREEVETTYPYNTNTQTVTTNDEDPYAPEEAANSYDPFADYAYLGDDISDGLLMWISIGIDMSADYTVTPAAEYTADGGINETGSTSVGNGTMSGNGTMPSAGNFTMSGAPTGSGFPNATATGSQSSGSGAPFGNATVTGTGESIASSISTMFTSGTAPASILTSASVSTVSSAVSSGISTPTSATTSTGHKTTTPGRSTSSTLSTVTRSHGSHTYSHGMHPHSFSSRINTYSTATGSHHGQPSNHGHRDKGEHGGRHGGH